MSQSKKKTHTQREKETQGHADTDTHGGGSFLELSILPLTFVDPHAHRHPLSTALDITSPKLSMDPPDPRMESVARADSKKHTPPSTPFNERHYHASLTQEQSRPAAASVSRRSTPLRPQQPGLELASSTSAPDVFTDLNPIRSRGAFIASYQSPAKAREEALDMGLFHLDTIQEPDSSTSFSPMQHTASPLGNKGKAATQSHNDPSSDDNNSVHPPSFAESQFATIIRRQRKRRVFSPTDGPIPYGGPAAAQADLEALKPGTGSQTPDKSRTPALEHGSPASIVDRKGYNLHLKANGTSAAAVDRDDPIMADHQAWEFAGWGSISMLELSPNPAIPETNRGADGSYPPPSAAPPAAQPAKQPVKFGQWKASAIAGNAVTGSVFYALPAVIAASSVMSPISLLVACLLLYPFRPIICELASAMAASNAGNYSYFSNLSTKTIALLAAAITMLDAISTAAVSAGTASAYISGEATNTQGSAVIDGKLISVLLLVGLSVFCLAGIRDSSTVALCMFSLHVGSMFALLFAACVAWARMGNETMTANWRLGIAELTSPNGGKGLARAIFDGICVAFVGLTGFECTPSYINNVREGQFPKALRNMHVIVLLVEAPLMLMLLAVVPLDQIRSGDNVLAMLGQVAGRGTWLKIFIVADACIVLCGGIITGAVAFCGLVEALCDTLVLPGLFRRAIPRTGAPYFSLALFLGLSLLMSATCGFHLNTISSVFSVSFLCVMTLFGVALLSLKLTRPTLPRSPISGLLMVLSGVAVGLIAMAGNFALAPIIIEQTLIYFVVLAAVLLLLGKRVEIAKVVLWLCNQSSWIQRFRPTAGMSKHIIRWVRRERAAPVVFFTKTDDISVLVNALYYIKHNEQTSNCKLVHCYKSIEDIPDQLDETFQLVDEIFPTITVDLVFVEAPFTPAVVESVLHRLRVPPARAFMACPSGRGPTVGGTFKLAEYGGLRIILP